MRVFVALPVTLKFKQGLISKYEKIQRKRGTYTRFYKGATLKYFLGLIE